MIKPKILYVDDEPLNLMLFRANLSKKYEILTAESGITGLEIIRNTCDICAVISDMRMPYMDGIEFIKASARIKPNISYYILSGFDISDEIQEALDSMLIRKYFRKPFNLKEIDKEIDCPEQSN
ncbi:response regulator [Maribellus sediminis]|uniref:response regulator n=1 Tax=Maribellus sediminis TaxID=2696285 RepID=UPI001430CFA6|nr:response regulator [Maribellus sediminis]